MTTEITLADNQYINFAGDVVTVENACFKRSNALEESEYYVCELDDDADEEDMEWCARFETEDEESVWLNEEGYEVTEYLSY